MSNVGSNLAKSGVEYTVYVVRLRGDATGAATAKPEGDGFVAADLGASFTIGGASAFPEYVSYSAQWLGDTEQDAALEWNDITYLAGFGSGSAGYQHAHLPQLTDSSEHEVQTQEIALSVGPDAYVEFRFKVRN